MKPVIALVIATILVSTAPAVATEATTPDPVAAWQADKSLWFNATDVELPDFQWVARPVIVFADTEADPRFQEQVELLKARPEELAARDVVVITDADPAVRSALRQKLRPRGFMLVLIGKDGGVKLRKPFPWDVRELTRAIDKMPLRQEEIRAQSQ